MKQRRAGIAAGALLELRRNVTIRGDPQAWPTLHFAASSANKIHLAHGVTLRFRWLSITGHASARNLGAGLDVIDLDERRPAEVSTAAAALLVEDGAIVYPFCWAWDLLTPYLRDSPRPPEAPGVNAFAYPSPLPEPLRYSPGEGGDSSSSSSSGGSSGCSNSTAAPLYARCYSQVGTYVDYAGHTFVSADMRAKDLWILRNVTSLCLHELDRACVEQLTPIGCLQYSYSAYFGGGLAGSSSSTGGMWSSDTSLTTAVSSPPPLHVSGGGIMAAADGGGESSGGGGGGGSGRGANVVAIVCGTVIGAIGCVLALILASGVVWLARRRRWCGRQQQQSPKPERAQAAQQLLLPSSPPPPFAASPDPFGASSPTAAAAAMLAVAGSSIASSASLLSLEGCGSGHHAGVLGSDTRTPIPGTAGYSSMSPAPSPTHLSTVVADAVSKMAVSGAAADGVGAGTGAAKVVTMTGSAAVAWKLLLQFAAPGGSASSASSRVRGSSSRLKQQDGSSAGTLKASSRSFSNHTHPSKQSNQQQQQQQLQQPQQEALVTWHTPPHAGLAVLPAGPELETEEEAQQRVASSTAAAGAAAVVAAASDEALSPGLSRRLSPSSRYRIASAAAVERRYKGSAETSLADAAASPTSPKSPVCAEAAFATQDLDLMAAVHAAEEDAAAGADLGVTLLPNAVLGKGSFGRVYEGRYRGQPVAVKVAVTVGLIGPAAAAEPQGHHPGGGGGLGVWDEDDYAVDSLRQEVEVLGRCAHPNVVKLLAVCLTPPRLCLVMELMETNLYRLLHRGNIQRFGSGGLLLMSMVFDVAIGVARALEYLHPTITHRDLKPANVLIRGLESGRLEAKLADFGLARLRHTLQATREPEQGTPGYTAPECFDTTNWVVSHHADMYSFGVLLWEMLTGLEPWKNEAPVVIAFRLAHKRETLPVRQIFVRRARTAGKAVVRLENLVRQCFEHDPRRRPAAAEAVKRLLLARQEWAAETAGRTA
ncbi:hypothetical protein HXX76_013925 [Chlamydomonas incerta]|uniref:Protein kinase domain-containing protein n=1 Tax=Chlamydomonas incerta TaxID=51695 RepID=A0A835VTW8_CHLIN|nr:hypothetical protein HXX76_013925 [Chlamydomonas incerta]|eukprot:KAG2425171.1 hypothetical protein HXX76_013925 [Chlamydomonas incerta]